MNKTILFTLFIFFLLGLQSCANADNASSTTDTDPPAIDVSNESISKKTNALSNSDSKISTIPVMNVVAGDKINSPFDFNISNPGKWKVEDGVLGTIQITDNEGTVLAEQELKSSDSKNFNAKLIFNSAGITNGRVRLISNPGAAPGLKADDKYSYEMPVTFK